MTLSWFHTSPSSFCCRLMQLLEEVAALNAGFFKRLPGSQVRCAPVRDTLDVLPHSRLTGAELGTEVSKTDMVSSDVILCDGIRIISPLCLKQVNSFLWPDLPKIRAQVLQVC